MGYTCIFAFLLCKMGAEPHKEMYSRRGGGIPRFSTRLSIVAQELNRNFCTGWILVHGHHEFLKSLRKVRMPGSEKGTVLAWRDATYAHDPVL